MLDLDLGYNVLNNEALRRSLGFTVDTLEDLADEEAREDRASVVLGREVLPSPSGLVQDKDFKIVPTPEAGLWSDEKFWGSGPSPFFFPNIFGKKRLRSYTFSGAVAGGNRMSKVRI